MVHSNQACTPSFPFEFALQKNTTSPSDTQSESDRKSAQTTHIKHTTQTSHRARAPRSRVWDLAWRHKTTCSHFHTHHHRHNPTQQPNQTHRIKRTIRNILYMYYAYIISFHSAVRDAVRSMPAVLAACIVLATKIRQPLGKNRRARTSTTSHMRCFQPNHIHIYRFIYLHTNMYDLGSFRQHNKKYICCSRSVVQIFRACTLLLKCVHICTKYVRMRLW